jgi:hypothetical protein
MIVLYIVITKYMDIKIDSNQEIQIDGAVVKALDW